MRKHIYWLLTLIVVVSALLLLDTLDSTTPTSSTTDKTTFHAAYPAIAKGFVDVEGGIIYLAAQRDGVIEQVLVEEGQQVKQGQVLATQVAQETLLLRNQVQAQMKEIEASIVPLQVNLHAAQREMTRYEALVNKQVGIVQRLDESRDQADLLKAQIAVQQAALASAVAQLAVAEYEIELRTIRAPMDGRIIKLLARPGAGLSTLNVSTLFWFAPDIPRIIRAELDERFVDNVSLGMKAYITPESNTDKTYPATVKRKGLFFGPKRPSSYDPEERADVRVLEVVLALDKDTPLLLGQRVIVRFGEPTNSAAMSSNSYAVLR